jgi:hypothetical protein
MRASTVLALCFGVFAISCVAVFAQEQVEHPTVVECKTMDDEARSAFQTWTFAVVAACFIIPILVAYRPPGRWLFTRPVLRSLLVDFVIWAMAIGLLALLPWALRREWIGPSIGLIAYGVPSDYTVCGSRSFAAAPLFGFLLPDTALFNRLDLVLIILTTACVAAGLASMLAQKLLRRTQGLEVYAKGTAP